MAPAKRTKFNVLWKSDSWLSEDLSSEFSFKCLKCCMTLELGNMGKGTGLRF